MRSFLNVMKGLVIASLSVSAFATSPSTVPEFFDVTPQTTSPHTNTDLYNIYTTGQGPYDPVTMDGKIFPYPLTVGGVAAASLYNGCYDRKNRRLHDLDPDNSCTTTNTAHPGDSIYRLFLGYKISCAATPTTPGICKDTQLMMNCKYEQVQSGTNAFEERVTSARMCSTERGIIRRARGNNSASSGTTGCPPGTDGTTYPTCTPCASGTYNSIVNPNTIACTACAPPAAAVLHGDLTRVVWATPTTPSTGAVSASQCYPASGLACEPGYNLSADHRTCEAAATNCLLAITIVPKNPSPAMADGAIAASVSGATGPVSGLTITAPTFMAPTTGGTGPTATFAGLPHNTYTVSATDSTCTANVNVTLNDAIPTPACSSCPPGSTLSGSNCVASPSTVPSASNYAYTCRGAGGCSSAACATTCQSGAVVGQHSSSDTTPASCNGNPYYVTWGGDCVLNGSVAPNPYTLAGSSSCPAGFILAGTSCTMACTPGPTLPSAPPSPCPLTLRLSETNSRNLSGGSIKADVSLSVGTVTFSMTPAGIMTSTATEAIFSGLAGSDPGTSYTVTARDSTCSVSATTSVYVDTICESLCSDGGTYYVDAGDFSRNRAGHQAVRFDGQNVGTCAWLKADGTLFGSPYVTCGTNNIYGGSCMTTRGATPAEKTYYLSSSCTTPTGPCSCAGTPW